MGVQWQKPLGRLSVLGARFACRRARSCEGERGGRGVCVRIGMQTDRGAGVWGARTTVPEATRTTCTPPLPHTKLNAKCRTRRCQFPPVLRGERAVVGHSKGYGHGGGGGVYARAWVAARPARFGCLLNAFKLVRSPDREAPEGYHCHRSFPAFEGRLLAAVPGEGVRGGSAGTPGAVSCRAGPHVHQCCGAVRGWSGGWGGRNFKP